MRTIDRVKKVIDMNVGASSIFRDLVLHLAAVWPEHPISLNRVVGTLDDDNLELYFDCLRGIRMAGSGLSEDFYELAASLREGDI